MSGGSDVAAGTAPYALEARGLTKMFGGFAAVKNVDLSVRRGAIHALIGPNGAGKTTCFNLLTKTLQPTDGTILFEGTDISRLRTADVARLGLVRSFQISAIFPQLTVLENVRVALQSSYGRAFQFWRSLKAVEPLNRRVMDLLQQVGLADSAQARASDLPYGKRRAMEIATTLALDPKVMLLDEPTAGMGHEDVEPITELIRRAAQGRTVVIVEHNLSVVSTLCDRITVLQHGSILTEGTYQDVSANPAVIEAYMGGVDEP
jgi:branched-chain amino acid transport system ATP-binding protein